MAGAGSKLFTSGSVLTANDVNTYLMDQTIMRFTSTTTRDAAFGGAGEPTLSEGMFAYTSDTNTLWFYTGSAWEVATIKPSLVDAKGDLLAGTAADTVGRLAVGTNGFVLTAASGETTGLKWVGASMWIPAAQFTAALGAPTLGVDGGWSNTAQSFRFADVSGVEACLTSFYIPQTGNLNFEAYFQGGGSGNFRLNLDSSGNRNPGTPGDTMFFLGGYNKAQTISSFNGLGKASFTDNMSVTAGGLVNLAFLRISNDAGDTSANTCYFFGVRAYYV